jgi:putative ABC transport system ATP-binding protein
MDLLRRIAVDQEAAIIVVTHDEMILDRFDHIFYLRDGLLEKDAPAKNKLHPQGVSELAVILGP